MIRRIFLKRGIGILGVVFVIVCGGYGYVWYIELCMIEIIWYIIISCLIFCGFDNFKIV